jgi:hypothetical protein
MIFFQFIKTNKSAEEANKSQNYSLIALCIILSINALLLLFFWWISIASTSEPSVTVWPNYDGLIILVAIIILCFYNSRIASLLFTLALLELVGGWIIKVTELNDFSPPASALGFTIFSGLLAISVFRVHSFPKNIEAKERRSNAVIGVLAVAIILTSASFIIPPAHFWYHIKSEVILTNQGNLTEYYEPLDRYSFIFPKTWTFKQPFLQYGSVVLSPTDASGVSIQIERWGGPWNIAPISVVNKDAFLKMAQGEANTYASDNKLTVNSVEMTGPKNINEAYAVLSGVDGSQRYIYYIYDTSWSRQTSASDWFLWELTATIPASSISYASDTQSILTSFKINQPTPKD